MNNTDRIQELADKIKQARHQYYNDEPTVSDAVFDHWYDELKKLDPTNSAITNVGAPEIPSEWKKVKHNFEMGSLDKINTPEGLIDWVSDKNISSGLFITEKLDGISINCVYEDGQLVSAITRGDSIVGDEISSNVKLMRGVKLNIPNFTGSIRGEIMMFNSIHQQYFADKSNPRNAASGISKRFDGDGSDKLNVLFYQVISEDTKFNTEQEQFEWLKAQKLDTPNHWWFANTSEANQHWREYQDQQRNKLDYGIDGFVVKLNDIYYQLSLGSTNYRPKGSIAMKFDNQLFETVIEKIETQVGNSGRLTPVATVKTINIGGADISRASIYNFGYIQQLKLDVGAKVLITRAGDIIPRVEEVVEETGTIFQKPSNCPECHTIVKEDGEFLLCPNKNCPAQTLGRISNWVSELNLLDWGDKVLTRLIEAGKVKNISDLYKLTVEDLASLERMGKKSAKNCLTILEANKEIALDLFLGGLSIPMIGAATIKLIMDAGFDTLEKIQNITLDELENVSGLGPVKSKSLMMGLTDNQELINKLLANGIKIKEKKMGKLTGKSFAFTGAMEHKRAELEQMVLDEGGEVKNGVGKSLTYLVMADPTSTSSKAEKARSLGTLTISEQDFINMLN